MKRLEIKTKHSCLRSSRPTTPHARASEEQVSSIHPRGPHKKRNPKLLSHRLRPVVVVGLEVGLNQKLSFIPTEINLNHITFFSHEYTVLLFLLSALHVVRKVSNKGLLSLSTLAENTQRTPGCYLDPRGLSSFHSVLRDNICCARST